MATQPRLFCDQRATRQLLVDVSIIAAHDAGTGIQRVVRSLLLQLLETPPPGFRIRPVRATRKRSYCYANSYLATLTSSASVDDDDDVQVFNGDVFLGLDLASRIVPRRQLDLLRWRVKGVRFAFVVYDLLPLLHRHWFTSRACRSFRHWVSTLAIHADTLICISNSVSNEVRSCMALRFNLTGNEPTTEWFHLGADLLPDQAPVATIDLHLADANADPRPRAVLMVGTIEPRKGHAQVLDAFDLLWRGGSGTRLIIAGKQGWHVDSFIERLTGHPEAGTRLLWLPDIDDIQLTKLYAELDGLIMASNAEGFGLPLVEAAQYGMPLFARNLPVFREVAGHHATYFTAESGVELAPQLSIWLDQLDQGTAPCSLAIKSLTWSASAEQLRELITLLAQPR
ncbi:MULTISPECIES: glycosyltransferase family 4 protein [Paraburkholderia]|uniref:Glycosyltransferase involved in cell wall biosynthesis n=2 Tax=Paraburkholderia TaxID=1822464 RepID=A0A7Y9WBS3_9BURK|nr:glycosyltransferase family 1 protein [Paraburkholderia bryophila]NYH17078.1 glycosyltransferase involved in cell wall biosynthesis [Paraburkholderia bryophila]